MAIGIDRSLRETALPEDRPVSVGARDVAVIVPMRGGSKRLPGKHARPLAGRSLPARTAAVLAACGLGDRVWLTTDDPDLAATGRALGWRVPALRPADLAGDATPTLDAVLHALDEMVTGEPAVVIVMQTTSPFCPADAPARALALLAERPALNSVLAVKRLHVAAAHVRGARADGTIAPLLPADAAEGRGPAFIPTGALYAVRTAALRRARSLSVDPVWPLELDEVAAVDIDTPEDWTRAEAFAQAGLVGRCLDIEEPA